MPIYEYECKKCGAVFEALIRGSDVPKCSSCGSENVGRLMSAPASSHSESSGAGAGGGHSHSCGCGCGCKCGRH